MPGALAGARIELDPKALSAVSDPQGRFSIQNVAAGGYTVTITYVGQRSDVLRVGLTLSFACPAVTRAPPRRPAARWPSHRRADAASHTRDRRGRSRRR
ncbi:MAG: hypothetical protein DMF96_04825 [Acidobacteria bacterium]|nr:MAG: hypothetical protein DMF96_04825 [Acidobacteriota bacterium]